MNIRHVPLILLAGIFLASCSDKPAPDRGSDAPGDSQRVAPPEKRSGEETPRPPSESTIGKDSVKLVRGTKVVPAEAPRDCPGCPAGETEVVTFRRVQTDAVSCSGDTCTVVVTIHAVFNPGSGTTFSGGLTAWIPPEQRAAYLNGQTPAGEKAYRVQITYKHRGGVWRALEFDRAPAE